MTRSVYLALALCVSATIGAHAGNINSQNSSVSPKDNPFKGIYLGVQMGNSETHYNLAGFDTGSANAINGTVNSSGFGQRGLAGFKINNYLAVEGGYTHYGNTNGSGLTYTDGTTDKSGDITENSMDLGLKGIFPFTKELHVYGKLGGAYLWSHTKVSSSYSKDRSAVRPMFGIGAGYNLNNHFVCDVFYNRIQSSGSIKSADLIGVGLYYYIG